MTKALAAALWLSTAGCATNATADDPDPAPASPPSSREARAQPTLYVDPPMAGFSEAAVREAVEAAVRARLGPAPAGEAKTAATSVMVSFHQGMPRPVQRQDGSWGYEPPFASAAVRTGDGWAGWRGGPRRIFPAAASAEIDRLLADPAFWNEPAYDPPTCTDSGAQRLVVRHGGRQTVRQQGCSGRGLTRRLFELVLNGP